MSRGRGRAPQGRRRGVADAAVRAIGCGAAAAAAGRRAAGPGRRQGHPRRARDADRRSAPHRGCSP
eukprot:6798275-Alexandrium_andersonii.AAC.1